MHPIVTTHFRYPVTTNVHWTAESVLLLAVELSFLSYCIAHLLLEEYVLPLKDPNESSHSNLPLELPPVWVWITLI